MRETEKRPEIETVRSFRQTISNALRQGRIERSIIFLLLLVFSFMVSSACGSKTPTPPPATHSAPLSATQTSHAAETSVTPSPSATPEIPLRTLTICLRREPETLFLYGATSYAAQSVLAAVYEGLYSAIPLENSALQPESVVNLQPVEIGPGDPWVDSHGNLVYLSEGASYRPSGCLDQACALEYSGDQPVQVDQMAAVFHLAQNLHWSDGAPLKGDDSIFSFEVASRQALLSPATLPQVERARRTQSYRALDEHTLEWRGLPGYIDANVTASFFPPLPRHAWGELAVDELGAADTPARAPLGWGPYMIDEWLPGERITLDKNPYYYRAQQGLPRFDQLVYRFIPEVESAVQALLAGECDILDPVGMFEPAFSQLANLEQDGRVALAFQAGTAWEQVTLGVESLDEQRPAWFAHAEVRQALSLCIDRQAITSALLPGSAYQELLQADAYLHPYHPLYNPDIQRYPFDPQQASGLLTAAGWLDLDSNPATPRTAQSVPGVPDGTPFSITYLVAPDPARQMTADIVHTSLAQCGVNLEIVTQELGEYLSEGPDGPVFGRRFDMAQFAWPAPTQNPCALFLSSEVPGPYPEHPKSWGGANASGYRSPEFDRYCRNASFNLPFASQFTEGVAQAQAIFAAELPAIPLYWHFRVIATRPDLCGASTSLAPGHPFGELSEMDYGEGCG